MLKRINQDVISIVLLILKLLALMWKKLVKPP